MGRRWRLPLAVRGLGDNPLNSDKAPLLPGDGFSADVSNETLALTTLGSLKVGSRVNLEVDVIARYLERLLQAPLRRRRREHAAGGLVEHHDGAGPDGDGGTVPSDDDEPEPEHVGAP